MKAVGYRKSLPVDHPEALLDLNLPKPQAAGRDLLVAVKAISVNPIDYKMRLRKDPGGEDAVLGWDVAGVVAEASGGASLFKPGDEVFYAGSVVRPGANCEFHLVDERIVGRKPKNLGFAEAAALPLTSITAWEMLFDRLKIPRDSTPRGPAAQPGALLIIGGAGGVGSIAIQLARQLTGITVIATASRPETTAWCYELGARHVIDHAKPMVEQLKAAGFPHVDYIFSVNATDKHFDAIAEAVAPQGRFGLIDDPAPFDFNRLKGKSVSLHWESMFTRSVFGTPDMIAQHEILNEVAALVERGAIRTTLAAHFGTINAANLKKAHALLQSGRSRGKIVLEGF